MWKWAVGFACALVLAPACAAELSQVGPLASGAAILGARTQIKEDGIETTVKISGGETPDTITLDIAEDFAVAYRVTSGTIYDFALRRVMALDDKAHTLRNSSLYAFVDFAVSETANRHMQREALKAVKVTGDASMLDAFWVQSELHVMAPEDGSPIVVRRADKDGSVHFLYDKKEVASYSLSKQAMSKAQSATLAKYLRFTSSLHPTIIDEIAASGRMPSRIAFDPPPMRKLPQAVWVFAKPLAVKSVFPVRAGIRPDITPAGTDPGTTTVRDLLPTMQAAIAGTAPGKRTVDDYRKAIDEALDGRKPFQAVLLSFELHEQYAQDTCEDGAPRYCHSFADVIKAARGDPRVETLGSALQSTHNNMDDAIAALKGLKRDDVTNPYVIDDFLANDLSEAGQNAEAMPLLANAIKGNPYLAGYYKDLGDAIRRTYQPDLAWLCYDLGRLIPGAADAPVISGVTKHEAMLAQKYPEFF